MKSFENIGKSIIVKPYASMSSPSNSFSPLPFPNPPIKLNFPSSIHGTGILFTIEPIVIKLPNPGLSIGATKI